jgi:hypothetical protein
LYLEATNIGIRPITVVGWGGEMVGTTEKLFFKAEGWLPRLLNDSERVQVYITDPHRIKAPLKSIHVWDSHDRHWDVDAKTLKGINEQLDKLRTEELAPSAESLVSE